MADDNQRDFVAQAAASRTTLIRELWSFLRENKKWWIAPIVLAALLLGLVAILAGTGAAPFIYTLF